MQVTLFFRIPPALSNFIDHFPYDCWSMKPGAIVTYSMGNFGGIVAGTQLRTMTHIIQLIAIPKGLYHYLSTKNHGRESQETDFWFKYRTLHYYDDEGSPDISVRDILSF